MPTLGRCLALRLASGWCTDGFDFDFGHGLTRQVLNRLCAYECYAWDSRVRIFRILKSYSTDAAIKAQGIGGHTVSANGSTVDWGLLPFDCSTCPMQWRCSRHLNAHAWVLTSERTGEAVRAQRGSPPYPPFYRSETGICPGCDELEPGRTWDGPIMNIHFRTFSN